MSNYVGGDFLEVFCSHPEYGQMRFYPKSNESFSVNRGGIVTNDDENQTTSAGDMIQQMNRTRWSVEGNVAVDMKGSKEEDFLQNVSASTVLGTWIFTHISGTVWQGQGKPVGASILETNETTLAMKIAGSRRLEKV